MTNIAGRVFSPQSMSGRKYVYEYPALLQATVDSSTFEAGHSDTISLPSKLYLQHGELELAASPNKRFFPGMLVTLSGDSNATEGYAVVLAYDASTGAMRLSVEGYSGAVIFGPFLNLQISVNGANFNSSTAHIKGSHGTSVKTPKEMFSSFRLNSPEVQAEEIRDDFISPINKAVPYPYSAIALSGLADFYSYPKPGAVSSFSPENRAGFLALEVKNAADAVSLQRGDANRNILFGDETLYLSRQFSFLLPALSTAGESFVFSIGYMSNDGTPETVYDAGGIGLTYTDGVNSGRFRVYYGTSGTVAFFNSAVAVAANTWYTLELRVYDTVVDVYLDGVLLTGISDADLVASGGNGDVFSPVFSIRKGVGSAVRLAIIDFFTAKEQAGR